MVRELRKHVATLEREIAELEQALALLANRRAQAVQETIPVSRVVFAGRSLLESHPRDHQFAAYLDAEQLAARDLYRRAPWPAHGPAPGWLYLQNALFSVIILLLSLICDGCPRD